MALVSSSRNSGTPSVLATICSITSAGSALPPLRRSTIALPCRAQTIERQLGDVGAAGPGRIELGPKRDQHQDGQTLDVLDHDIEQLERGRVDPVHVLVDREHRLTGRQPLELVRQHAQRPLLLQLWCEVERRIACADRKSQESRHQRYGLAEIGSRRREQPLQLVELGLGAVATLESRGPLQQADDRMERRCRCDGENNDG